MLILPRGGMISASALVALALLCAQAGVAEHPLRHWIRLLAKQTLICRRLNMNLKCEPRKALLNRATRKLGPILSRGFCAVLMFVLVSGYACPVQATPVTWSDKINKPLKFPKGSTLNVYIQKDPKGSGRDQLVKEGVERWIKTLGDRGIVLNVAIGDPPAGSKNPIGYTWQNDGFTEGGLELGSGKNDAIAGPDAVGEGDTQLTEGSAALRNALPAKTESDKTYLRNLAEHELTHILGLADDDKGSVTKHEQPSSARERNDQDGKEINQLYGTATTGGAATPIGIVTPAGGGTGLGFFQYHFDFLAANAVPDPNDPEHISLITLTIDPRIVTGLELPPGWIGLVPTGAVSVNDPFFAEGYMVDATSSLPPWDPTNPMSYIALRTSVQEAIKEGLPSDFDPALTLDSPEFDIKVFTIPNVALGLVHVYAGGHLQTVAGPVPVPEPSTLLLIVFGSALIISMKIKAEKGRQGTSGERHRSSFPRRPESSFFHAAR